MLLSKWTLVASGMRSHVLGYIAQPHCKTAWVDRSRSFFLLLFLKSDQGTKISLRSIHCIYFMARVWYLSCKDPVYIINPE